MAPAKIAIIVPLKNPARMPLITPPPAITPAINPAMTGPNIGIGLNTTIAIAPKIIARNNMTRSFTGTSAQNSLVILLPKRAESKGGMFKR
jgi:hypothetical protein